ncbi:MAG: 2-dehydro-3-deoxyphosphooctonate aldolase (KDO 8-P synthase) [Puniceicoccaceae bacterium 5H]|nr:MAG: 2-dehydro-3-deoxyphosphooctonate aldolase (KDO 8-P synthase) [Puniceicoccaceae bacterium 5H]
MSLFDPQRLLLIAGPCSLESFDTSLEVARELSRLRHAYEDLNIVFKGSFDKANRTSLDSPRGPGLQEGLEILSAVKEETGLPLLTDIHYPEQASPVGKVCDVLQIPAFLCRQTDLLVAAAQTSRVVNVKKGQFLSAAEMRFVIDKLEGADAEEIWQTERGTTFGYQNLVVDMRNFDLMRAYGHPTIMDATHSVQLPGAGGGKTSGERQFVPLLVRAALAAGANGVFVETHPKPDEAISDGPNQVPLGSLETLVRQALGIWRAARTLPELSFS